MSILQEIVAHRRSRVAREGHCQGESVPALRSVPLTPFSSDPFLICEIKRRSPSRGDIAEAVDAGAQADAYARRGCRTFSVLTEQKHFRGSLADLMEVKRRHPECTVLRKDFLLDAQDVEVSFRAGADAVLLLAAVLTHKELRECYHAASRLGMQALVEVHDRSDLDKARRVRPEITGINCRDLRTFTIDRILPLRLSRGIDWPTRLIYESGIRHPEDAALARSARFDGVLVGEAVMRNPNLTGNLVAAVAAPPGGAFWPRLYGRSRPGRPLVKICGITSAEDARLCSDAGADVLGLVFAPSPRRASPALLEDLDEGTLRVGVVVAGPEANMDPDVGRLLRHGLLDAIQFHGTEAPDRCASAAFPYYKAMRIRDEGAVSAMHSYRCPRVLADAYVPGEAGGTGTRISDKLVEQCRAAGPLWLAGGLGPETVGEAMERFRPELVDASSGLEREPGIKDPAAVERYFQEIENHANPR